LAHRAAFSATLTSHDRPVKRTIGILLLALALTGVVSLSLKEYRLALIGERTTGVVAKVEKITTSTGSDGYYRNGRLKGVKRGSELTFMYLDFTTPDGQARQVKTLATFHTAARAGDVHPMIYLPSQPENAKIYSARQLWLPMTVGTVFSVACCWGGLRLLRRRAPMLPSV
jgi:hypothetical protein